MDRQHQDDGWTVSQVQCLIDLSRRDIQRSASRRCNKDGEGIDVVRPSTQKPGYCHYDTTDLARLLLVKLYRGEGHNLKVVGQLIKQQDKRTDTYAQLCEWEDEFEARLEDARLTLNRIRLLKHFASPEQSHAKQHVERQMNYQLLEAIVQFLESQNLELKELGNLKQRDGCGNKLAQAILNSPAMDLAIELLEGPGVYKALVEATLNQKEKQHETY